MSNDERYYNSNKINFIFAIAGLFLLGLISLMFLKDYQREWKDYQKQFRQLEIEKTRVKFDQADIDLQADTQYTQLQEELEKAQKDFEANCQFGDLEKELKDLRAKDSLIEQKYKFTKAELDAAKYRYEAARAHHEANVSEPETEYNELVKQEREYSLELQESQKIIKERQKIIDSCRENLKELERSERKLASRKDLFQRKLDKIDPNEMSFVNQIANLIRDLPIIDLANPNTKIEQVVINEITDDVNFANVPKVERCISCHLGIADPTYETAGQPFKTHPNLDLYVGKNSPHPLEEFGCTVCHGGRGRGTDFVRSAHTPSSKEQKKEWQEKYGWEKMHLWEEPMLPVQYTEAGCFKCHSNQTSIKGAETLNLGLHLIEKAGCYGCHEIKKYKNWEKAGPNLNFVKSKISKEWAYKWIKDPKSFRHNTWMPTYFDQSNNSDPVSKIRSEQEILSIVEYLFNVSEEYPMRKMPFAGNPKEGEELVASLGCMACHQVQEEPPLDESITRADLRRQHGPNLIGLGSKTSKEWIYHWLKDPASYHPTTRMPNLRLSDKEAAHIAAYLAQSKNDDFDKEHMAQIKIDVLNDIVLEFLRKSNTDQEARSKLAEMKKEEKLVFAGEKLIRHYGCYSCHDMDGFAKAKPIGIELTEEGSKSLHNLDFGFIHIEHTKPAWFEQKLKDPRIFDKGKELAWLDQSRMPNFKLTQQEIQAITTAILGFVENDTVQSKIKPRTPENILLEQGQQIVRQFNCQGCHIIEGDGGAVQDTVKDYLIKYEERTENEAEKVKESFSPPNLYGVGGKLNPNWLFEFLHSPDQTIRPWLKVRMPTYSFNAAHLNTLLKYFSTLDGAEFPFAISEDLSISRKELDQAERLFSQEYFGCTQCHVVGDSLPTGSQDSWAPNLALAKSRLRPGWLLEWIKNPQDLMPGTKMPTFFDPQDYENSGPEDIADGDEDLQIKLLRNYLFTLSDSEQKKAPQAAPQPNTENQDSNSNVN